MKKRSLSLILIFTLIISCGIPEKDFNKLKTENEKLKTELEECQFGSEKLLSNAKSYFEKDELIKTKNELNILIKRHPGSKEAKEGFDLLSKVNLAIAKIENEKKITKEKRLKKEKKEKERKIREEKNRLANATRKMRKTYDDINETYWYRDKTSPRYNNYNGFFAYFGKSKNGAPWLRLSIQYAADDWLFIEKYIIKVDGRTYTITEQNYGEIETDNGSGGIWEWLDRAVSSNEMEIIEAVAYGKNVKIRFNGKQYYKDKTITYRQKLALRNVLDAYKALGGS